MDYCKNLLTNFTPKFLYKEKLINKTVEVKTMKDYIHDMYCLLIEQQNIFMINLSNKNESCN